MLSQDSTPMSKLKLQQMVTFVAGWVGMPVHPNDIPVKRAALTNANVNPLHKIKQVVVEAAEGNKYLVAITNVTKLLPLVENPPPLLQNPKRTLDVFWILSMFNEKTPASVWQGSSTV